MSLLAREVTNLEIAEGFKILHGGYQQRLVLCWISSIPKGPRAWGDPPPVLGGGWVGGLWLDTHGMGRIGLSWGS